MVNVTVKSCKECTAETGRHSGCHSTCEVYKKFRAELDETNRKKVVYKRVVDDIICTRRELDKYNPKIHQI